MNDTPRTQAAALSKPGALRDESEKLERELNDALAKLAAREKERDEARAAKSWPARLDAMLERISNLKLGKTIYEDLADAVQRVIAELAAAIARAEKAEAELEQRKTEQDETYEAAKAELNRHIATAAERDSLAAHVKRLESIIKMPSIKRHQPCGCVVCVCQDEEQCHGCGARSCGKPDCVFNGVTGRVEYDDAPTYIQLRAQVAELEKILGIVRRNCQQKVSFDGQAYYSLEFDEASLVDEALGLSAHTATGKEKGK